MFSAWNTDRIEQLKSLLDDGLSAAQIAANLGGVTRNSVIGKVSRLGLNFKSKHATSSGMHRIIRPARARRNGGAVVASIKATRARAKALCDLLTEPTILAPEPISSCPPIALLDLRDEHCRWPIGDPGEKGFGFCGAPRHDNTVSYCAGHCRIAYRPLRNISEAERERRRQLGKRQVASGAWTCGF